uniref:DEUBAD domain-containing protein n=1 Tax=Strigamia maritima TaxID=126957 RepID=T1INL3_STRMM
TRKRTRRPTGSQVEPSCSDSIDLETPGSILVNTDLKALISRHTFNSLPQLCQYKLMQLLPEVDRVVNADSVVRLAATALNNEFFGRACQDWRERLSDGEFIPENQSKLKAEAEKDQGKLDQWKLRHFEPVWGQETVKEDEKEEIVEEEIVVPIIKPVKSKRQMRSDDPPRVEIVNTTRIGVVNQPRVEIVNPPRVEIVISPRVEVVSSPSRVEVVSPPRVEVVSPPPDEVFNPPEKVVVIEKEAKICGSPCTSSASLSENMVLTTTKPETIVTSVVSTPVVTSSCSEPDSSTVESPIACGSRSTVAVVVTLASSTTDSYTVDTMASGQLKRPSSTESESSPKKLRSSPEPNLPEETISEDRHNLSDENREASPFLPLESVNVVEQRPPDPPPAAESTRSSPTQETATKTNASRSCPVRTVDGVNLERSYQICQAVLQSSKNREALQQQHPNNNKTNKSNNVINRKSSNVSAMRLHTAPPPNAAPSSTRTCHWQGNAVPRPAPSTLLTWGPPTPARTSPLVLRPLQLEDDVCIAAVDDLRNLGLISLVASAQQLPPFSSSSSTSSFRVTDSGLDEPLACSSGHLAGRCDATGQVAGHPASCAHAEVDATPLLVLSSVAASMSEICPPKVEFGGVPFALSSEGLGRSLQNENECFVDKILTDNKADSTLPDRPRSAPVINGVSIQQQNESNLRSHSCIEIQCALPDANLTNGAEAATMQLHLLLSEDLPINSENGPPTDVTGLGATTPASAVTVCSSLTGLPLVSVPTICSNRISPPVAVAVNESSSSERGVAVMPPCACNLKAMIICKSCGAFCHDDCIGPLRLCVTCLIR